jgi:hypothetical protein
MKFIRSVLLISLVIPFAITLGLGRAEYSKKERVGCSYCHPPGRPKELTDVGKYYKFHNHSLKGYQPPEVKQPSKKGKPDG